MLKYINNSFMQNIVISNYSKINSKVGPFQTGCFNELTNTFYLLDSLYYIHIVEYNPQTDEFTGFKCISTAQSDLQGLDILDLTYIVDQSALFCVTKQGLIVKIKQTGETEILADNSDGIQTACWSPSQQSLLLVSKNNTLIQLNSEADLMNQIPLNDSEKEGQFNKANISWKADGKYFAINFAVQDGRKVLQRDNMLNVFKSPAKSDPQDKGLVQSVSQAPLKSMGEFVAWQPSGSIIAGYDRKGKQGCNRIIFWQKNGLRHLEFDLPGFAQKINKLSWSSDSQILIVEIMVDNQRHLMLYHRANYHWYLKNVIDIGHADLYFIPKFKKNKLIIVGEYFEVLELSIEFSESCWKGYEQELQNPMTVHYSVDYNKVLVTDYSRAVIPPPYSEYQIQTQKCVLAVAKIVSNYLLVITSKNIVLYNCQKKLEVLNLKNTLQLKRYWNVHLVNVDPLQFTVGHMMYTLKDLNLVEEPCEPHSTKKVIQIGEQLIEVYLDYSKLYVNDKLISEQCTSFNVYDIFLLYTNNSTGMYQKLYVFNLEISNFLWNGEHADIANLIPLSEDKSLNVRLIQRGSKIIDCSLGRIIFQLPRGNLETVYPKIITIKNVKRCIERMEYMKAFEMVRTHKLDMNLIFDMKPEQFMQHSDKVLTNIHKIDYINLFISSLKEGYSNEIKYCLSGQELQRIQQYFLVNCTNNKIKLVCDTVSSTLRAIDTEKYILSIFTSQVKKGELAKVLTEIKSIRANDVQIVVSPHLEQQPKKLKKLNSREILEYVCWLADPQVIYQVALLTYDLELVAMAAQFTQKDPKQYVPYLEQLKAIKDEVERRTKICLDLKKYDQAIQQLSKGSTQDKDYALKLIRQHNLFKKGIQVFREDKVYLLQTRIILAQYLQNKEEMNEALIVYQTSGLLDKALELAIKLFNVKKSKQYMMRLGYSNQRILETFKTLILKAEGTYPKHLPRAYLEIGDYENAVKSYIRQDNFRKASECIKYLSEEFINNQVVPAYKLAYSLKYNLVLKQKKTFLEKQARLLTVQKNKKNTPALNIVTKEGDEMYSEISGMTNQSRTNYTVSTTTGMKKKKIKVKGILQRNVKEGSALEEDFIVAYLNDMITKAPEIIKQNKLFIQNLIYLNLLEEAESLRNETRTYAATLNKRIRMYKEIKYEQQHPDVLTIYPAYVPKVADSIQSFDYLL